MGYEKKKEESKQEVAYQFIKDSIINNKFLPNTMLVENNLCNMLGFSKTPIREALRRLTSEGFVEFIPEKGCFVSVLTFREFIDIFDAREALEGMAARLCAQYGDVQVASQLSEQISRFKKYLAIRDFEQVLDADTKQHGIIVNASRNARLGTFLDTLTQQIKRVRLITMEDFERLSLSYNEHKQIVDAIIEGDPDLAETACRTHIRSTKNFLINKNYLSNSSYLLYGEKP